jgi:hypothetical protein
VIAFARMDGDGTPVLVTIISRRGAAPIEATAAVPGRWRSVLDDGAAPVEDSLDVGAALARFPAAVLVRAAPPVTP